jgi:hypothetical protein
VGGNEDPHSPSVSIYGEEIDENDGSRSRKSRSKGNDLNYAEENDLNYFATLEEAITFIELLNLL